MATDKLTLKINTDEAIEKLNQVKQLILEIKELLGSIKIELK